MAEPLSDVRKRAWATRRSRYGQSGHGGTYSRLPAGSPDSDGMLALIIRLHNEGQLSEGQVAKATGLDRIRIRTLADEAQSATRPTATGGKDA